MKDKFISVPIHDLHHYVQMIYEYDVELVEHCKRVFWYCSVVSDYLFYNKYEELCRAALIHDIGKIMIPKYILNKSTQLNKLDKLMISSHARWGYELLSASELTEVERQMILFHHGFICYPALESIESEHSITPCVDNDILEGSLIMQACDIYDAVTSDRPYHVAKSHDIAMQALRDKHLPKHICDVVDLSFKHNDLPSDLQNAIELILI